MKKLLLICTLLVLLLSGCASDKRYNIVCNTGTEILNITATYYYKNVSMGYWMLEYRTGYNGNASSNVRCLSVDITYGGQDGK